MTHVKLLLQINYNMLLLHVIVSKPEHAGKVMLR